MKQELKHGDIIFFASTGSAIARLITTGQSLGEKTKSNSDIYHVGMLSNGDTMIEMLREGIISSSTVGGINPEGDLTLLSPPEKSKTLKSSDYFVFRYGPTSDPFDRSSLDLEFGWIRALVHFADCKGILRTGSFPDSKKIVEIKLHLQERIKLQEKPEAKKVLENLYNKEAGELRKLLRDALRFECSQLATDIASSMARESHDYKEENKHGPIGKYLTTGAVASVCFTKCRSGTLQKEHVEKFMKQVRDFDLDKSFYCSSFVAYVYGLAVTILEGDWADKEWAINKNIDKVSPSELFSHLRSHPNWTCLSNKNFTNEGEKKRDSSLDSSSLSSFVSNSSSSSITSSSNPYSLLSPSPRAAPGSGVDLHKVELKDRGTCCG